MVGRGMLEFNKRMLAQYISFLKRSKHIRSELKLLFQLHNIQAKLIT
jgi:hypothetical protein